MKEYTRVTHISGALPLYGSQGKFCTVIGLRGTWSLSVVRRMELVPISGVEIYGMYATISCMGVGSFPFYRCPLHGVWCFHRIFITCLTSNEPHVSAKTRTCQEVSSRFVIGAKSVWVVFRDSI